MKELLNAGNTLRKVEINAKISPHKRGGGGGGDRENITCKIQEARHFQSPFPSVHIFKLTKLISNLLDLSSPYMFNFNIKI